MKTIIKLDQKSSNSWIRLGLGLDQKSRHSWTYLYTFPSSDCAIALGKVAMNCM
jgi:hypothetical protein